MGILYIVSTPIGNLGDITLRALEILRSVDLIWAEDTRHTGLLLSHFQIKKPLLSYEEHNELRRMPQIIEKIKKGFSLALVSDAGTPTLSDPGFKLVRECIRQGLKVEAIPGPSAILTALVSSGLPPDKFLFLGYLPLKKSHRQKLLQNLPVMYQYIKTTVIFFEAPHRLVKTLEDILEILGDREIVICRELTKVYEEIRREKVSQSIKHFEKIKPKGEFTLLF